VAQKHEESSVRSGDALRRRAEQVLRDGAAGGPSLPTAQALDLIHELRVYQIELELQNAELRRTQEALDIAHERYFELYDSAPVGYLTVSEDGRILELNRHAAGLLGLSQTALGDVRLSRLVAPEDQNTYYLYHRRLTTTTDAAVCELRLLGAGNERFWARLEAVAARDPAAGERVFRTALTAIGDRKRAEQASHEREAMFRSLFDRAPIGKCLTLLDGRLSLVNQRLAEMLGHTIDELHDLDFAAFTHPDDVAESRDHMRRMLADERSSCAFEKRYLHRDGHVIHASVNTALLRDAEGTPRHFITTIEDIGGRLQAEEERQALRERLATAERMASMGLLAAGLAHEINNPLSAVVGNLAIVLRDARLCERGELADLRGGLLDAQEGSNRVKLIARDLRIFARGSGEEVGPVDVQHVLESTLRMAGNELRHRARIVTSFAPTPGVLGSESRLGQVFLNLLVNAAQSIPEGRADENEVRVETSVDDAGRVVAEVTDTGVGIDQCNLDRLFDPFFTTKAVGQGMGLGLSICHRLVTELGGTITVQSAVGRGTAFRVALPALSPQPKVARAGAPEPVQSRRGRILVIDDEPMVTALVRRLLGGAHEVVAVGSGREALVLFEAGERFDVILCDLMMPEITGMDVHAELARKAPDQAQAMVLMTGGAFTERGKAFLSAFANPRLEKPFAPAELLELIARRLIERSVAGPH